MRQFRFSPALPERPVLTLGDAVIVLGHRIFKASPKPIGWKPNNFSRSKTSIYVTDSEERLLGVVTFRDLLITPGDKKVEDVMCTDVITAPEHLDQAALSQLLIRHNLQMIPVIDSEKRIKRVVTKDDIAIV